MKVLGISEHYFPRVGGTVSYLHATLSALAQLGIEAELWVPGPEPQDWLPADVSPPRYHVRWIDADYPAFGDPTRAQRYAFCRLVNQEAASLLASAERPDILHVLFGLFVMEELDTELLRAAGVPTIATVHNVPPMECRQVTPNAPLLLRLKEALRLIAVTAKNRGRLSKHRYDAYVVPSNQVRDLLAPLVFHDIDVVGHGSTPGLLDIMTPPPDRRAVGTLRLLTAGGYAPHKRQHIIPAVADELHRRGLAFVWDVVGPPDRIGGYHATVKADAERRGLGDVLRVGGAVPLAELAQLYDGANIYIQPSIEEGFCITALDAAAAGLPVIGSQAGALPEIIKASGGQLVESDPAAVAEAIFRFARDSLWQDARAQSARVRSKFSWLMAAESLRRRYQHLLEIPAAAHG